jgi:hypothetical protein
MTRILSELLGAKEPAFQHGIRQLERASGGANEDIRLTTEIMHGMQERLRQLGLDPHDTTGRELYAALMQKVRQDSETFQELLGIGQDQVDISAAVAHFVTALDMPKQVFALRAVAAKKILRKYPPKKAMKHLGYRSVESMLKHEPCGLILTAAHLTEAAAWHKSLLAAYKRLSASDFEARDIQVLAPVSARWRRLASEYVMQARQNVVGFRELGVVVLLPLPMLQLEAAPLAVTLLAIQAVNDVSTASSYLKMHQVRPDFGVVVAGIARNEPLTKAQMAGSQLPWKVVHRYFAKNPEAYNPHIFEPHVHQEDLRWHAAEDVLSRLHPRFAFWEDTSYLGLLAKAEGRIKASLHEPVSLNFIDAVLSLCNKLPYERRFVRYFRDHAWHELMLRYMRQANIERTVHEQLSGELLDHSVSSLTM